MSAKQSRSVRTAILKTAERVRKEMVKLQEKRDALDEQIVEKQMQISALAEAAGPDPDHVDGDTGSGLGIEAAS